MPFVPALNTVRTAINFISATGEKATNVLHFRNADGAINVAAINVLHDLLEDWLTTYWAGVSSQDWQTDLFVSTDMTVPDGIQATRLVTISGTVASPSLPAQNTLAVSLRTGNTGRSRRGRVYHVGLAEQQVVGSRVNLLDATNIPAAYAQLRVVLDVGQWEWVVASYVSGGVPRETALLSRITECILTDTVVDSMDTRKPRTI